MTDHQSIPGKAQKQRSLIFPILGSIAAIVLILLLGYVANRLAVIGEKMDYQPPTATLSAGVLPAGVASGDHAIYVPAYSHIYSRGGAATALEITLSVRNTDPDSPIRIDRVRYFDTAGKPIREFGEDSLVLGPLQTAAYLVEASDSSGGSGANFVVEWSAAAPVNAPLMEAIMIGTDNRVSFGSRGVAVERH